MKINNDGHLKNNVLVEEINNNLPLFDLTNVTDVRLLAALQRDYCFLASAYSLESCHTSLVNSDYKDYGKATEELPPQLAVPLLQLSKKNNVFPWLDYAYGYGLNNAVLREGEDNTDYNSYNTIRTFNGNQSEEGFINVHVAMVSQSGDLLKYQQECLESIATDQRDKFNSSLQKHFDRLYSIVDTLQQMWKASSYNDYLSFRTFIMGQIGNERCYPNENIVFDMGDSKQVHQFRGETGAQDSIVPSVDSFLQLDYPVNKLTEYLYDLRQYRPKDHQEYINFVKESSDNLEFSNYCFQDTKSSILLLKNLNCLRMFRKKHWNLTKKYIIQTIKHPVATGGTPITTWLPNQLGATLEYMNNVVLNIDQNNVDSSDLEFFQNMKIELSDHIQSIMDEVNAMQHEFKKQDHSSFLIRD
jgi:indoleamine 2,3-dioxygenase